MSPYRQAPPTVQPLDPPELKKVIALRQRYAHLDESSLWPPPARQPFEQRDVTMAVSGDGRRIFVAVKERCWILDAQTMVATWLGVAPAPVARARLDDDGSRAVVLCGASLCLWDLASASEPDKIWRDAALQRAAYLCLSPDGRIAVTAASSKSSTVRVFDLDRRTLVYSFVADCKENMQLHPRGRHLGCFGDDGVLRLYGEDGLQKEVPRTGGGAFSRDGRWLLVNNLDLRRKLRLISLDIVESMILLVEHYHLQTSFDVKSWGTSFCWSPSGRRALVKSRDDAAYAVSLGDHDSEVAAIKLPAPMRPDSAFIGDERQVLIGPTGAYHDCSAGVLIDCDKAMVSGAILGAGNEEPVLVGAAPFYSESVSFFGRLESGDDRIVEADTPYERPAIISQLLCSGTAQLDRSSAELFREITERWAVWQPFVGRMTSGISLRQLVQINRGLIHLTDEIVFRAEKSCQQLLRFGEPQLNLAALQTAADQLRSMTADERDHVFQLMLERLRSTAR